jgi:hypothetical protein
MSPSYYPSLQDQPSHRGLSLNGYMMMLIAAILLPMLALVAIIAWDYGTAARRTIEAQRLDVAGNLEIMIDREIERTVGFLDGLSNATGLRTNRADVVERVTFLARDRGFTALGVYDLNGQPMAASAGLSPRVSAEMVGLAEIKSGRRHFVSNLIADAGERPGLFFVSVPMRVEGRVVAMLSGGMSPSRLQRLFAEAGLRDGWNAGIVDRNGILLARSRQPEIFVGLEAQKPMVEAARGTAVSGLFDVIDRDGVSVKNAFERSSTTGWTAAVAVPSDIVEAPLRRTALIMTATGVVMTLLSLVAAFAVSSHLSRAIRRLGIAAVAIASGDHVAMPESNISELRDASRSIAVTGALARQDRRANIKSVP